MTIVTVLLIFLCILLGVLLVIACKRILQYQGVIDSTTDSVDALVFYCDKLKRQALISDAPEVIDFHRMVMNVANNFKAATRPEEERDG